MTAIRIEQCKENVHWTCLLCPALGTEKSCFTDCSHNLGKMSGPAQPVMVFTMNYISMKMDMEEGIRLHFVSKKEERRQMGVSQKPADRHTKCFWGGGGVQRWEFRPQRWSRWVRQGRGSSTAGDVARMRSVSWGRGDDRRCCCCSRWVVSHSLQQYEL